MNLISLDYSKLSSFIKENEIREKAEVSSPQPAPFQRIFIP